MLDSNRNRGFSLIELMVVVAIAAILLSIAIPSYQDYTRRGSVAEVTAALAGGRVIMEQFFLDNRTYEDAPWCDAPPSTSKFAVTCVSDATTYTITATGAENLSGFVFTLDQADVRTSQGGWAGSTAVSCWITRKGDAC